MRPRAIIENGRVYLRQSDGSYRLQDPAADAPQEAPPSDAEIDRRIADDPDSAAEPSDADLRSARVVKPYSASEHV